MKAEEKSSSKMYSLLSDNKYIYIVPSMLDVLGTIVDTAGLYYVCFVGYRQACLSVRCSKAQSYSSPIS